ncbi:MAG: zinc-dependent metalloproteinase lipoprotein [Mediterranea sp.]|jgi:zinc-dependent metalloproteinase lipoprotein|nr:zinc-dependent metalloproteinase lipoprotein [Mediterranea sp.]
MMKTPLPYLLTCFACTAFLLTGCGGSNDDPIPAVEEVATLEVLPTSFPEVSAAGETISFNVTSNTSWKITSNSTWCSLSVALGVNDKTITATVAVNEGELARTATITILATEGNLRRTVIVKQKALTLEVSPTSFAEVEYSGGTISFDVTSDSKWSVTNDSPSWCTLEGVGTGTVTGNKTITATIAANETGKARKATITILVSQNLKRTVTIEQEASAFSADAAQTYHYVLPVIFHVFSSSGDQSPNLTYQRAVELIDGCNRYYQNKLGSGSQDFRLTFELTTTAAPGKTITEPGIERITMTSDPTMDCDKFMSDRTNVKYLWNPNEYINIMVYPFKRDPTSDGVTLGIAYLPYVVSPASIGGLPSLQQELVLGNLTYPHCISLNKSYINEEESVEGEYYNGRDPIGTLAHEMGHYLGLHHAFGEADNGNIDLCQDTDYCDDTPAYNRNAYMNFLDSYTYINGSSLSWDDLPYLMSRTDCLTGEESTPNNVMDYYYSWQNRFTPEQEARVRYVLNYGTLVPGPKVGRSARTRAVDGPIDLPRRMMR